MDFKKFEKLNKEKDLIKYGDRIIIAMSGGPDSIFLYELLKKKREEMGLKIYFTHINHGLRGKNSDGDEEFVIKLGELEKIPTYTKKVDIKKYAKLHNLSEEEAGREVRYGFFREIKEKLGATKVALAHNEDDVVETFMFRLIRGTSFKGLEGIPVKREFFPGNSLSKYSEPSCLTIFHSGLNSPVLFSSSLGTSRIFEALVFISVISPLWFWIIIPEGKFSKIKSVEFMVFDLEYFTRS